MQNEMLSGNRVKFLKSLQIKKIRSQENLFLVQGAKTVAELLASDFETLEIYARPDFLQKYGFLIKNHIKIYELTQPDLERISTFQTNNAALALAQIPKTQAYYANTQDLVLALDAVRDPGNMGTIIRVADWFGIRHIICSPDCVEWHNPKTISASMGSFIRVNMVENNLAEYIRTAKKNHVRIYAATLEGEPADRFAGHKGILILGNESKGICQELLNLCDNQVSIVKYGGAESLNVAMAAGILCDNFLRNTNFLVG